MLYWTLMFKTSHNLVDIKSLLIFFQYSDNWLTNWLKVFSDPGFAYDQPWSFCFTRTIKDAVTMRNGSKFPNFWLVSLLRTSLTQCIKAALFASPGHNCSQPLEHCNKKATDEGNPLCFRNWSCKAEKKNSSYQNSMATPNDDEVAGMLADMRDSQTPAISSIKSPTKRGSSDSEV